MKKIPAFTIVSCLLLETIAFGKVLGIVSVTIHNVLSHQSQERTYPEPYVSENCSWTEKTVTISGLSSIYVWIAPQVQAYTCTDDGKPSRTGRFVFINNGSATPFYYRAVVDSDYLNPAKRSTLRVTSGNVYFYEIPSMTSRILDCSAYESRQSLALPTEAALIVKFCRSNTGRGQSTASTIGSSNTGTITFDLDSLNVSQGTEAYAFINYTCGRKNIHYVSEVFRYKIGKEPEYLKKNLLRSYWELIKDRTERQYGFDELIRDNGNDCLLYFEGGRVPLNREEAIEIRDGIVKPLERVGTRVHTVKIKQ